MKLLLTTDTVGGVWTYAMELAESLAAWQVRIALATMGAPLSDDQRAGVERLDHVTVHASGWKLEWMDEPWADVDAAGRWLRRIAADFEPDVIHLNGYPHAALDWGRPVLVAGHSCVLSWWRATQGEEAPPSWGRYRLEVMRGLRSADLVVAPTAAMLDELHRYYGPLPRTRVIPNGRDPHRFLPSPKQPIILTAGRLWDQAKNVATLSRIAARLPWPLFVAGDSRHPDGGLADLPNVRLLGKLPQASLASWFGRAAVYALPARYEPFGLSVLEAAMAGCALVLGDIPSLRQTWADAAVFVDPQDAGSVEAGIRRLCEDSTLRCELAARARERAGRYTSRRMAEQYMAAYHELALAAPQPRPSVPPVSLPAEASAEARPALPTAHDG